MASESDTDDAVLPERRRSRVVWKVDLPSLLNLIFAYKRGASVTFDEVKTALVECITNEPKPISKAVRNVTERNLIYALITEFPKMRFKPKEKIIRNLEILSKRKKSSEVGIRRNFYETTDTAEKRRSRHLSFQENDLGVISQGQLLSPFSDNASTAGSDCTEAAFSRNLDVAELFGEGKIDSWFSDVPTDLDYVNSWLSLSNTPAPSTIPDNTSEPIGIATENTISIKADRSANTGLNLDSLKLPNSTKHNLKAIEEPLHNLQPRFKAPETPDIVITDDSIDQTSEAQLQSSAPRMRKQGLYSNVNKIEEQKNILNENEKQNGLIGNKKASSSKDESSNCESNDTKKEEKTHKLGETDPDNKTESKNASKFPSKSSKISDRFGAFSKKLEETKAENDQKPLKTLKKTSIANSSIADKITKEAQNNRNEAEKTETKSEKTTETSSQNKNITAKNTKESEVTSAPNNNAAQDDSVKNQIKMNQLSSKENAEKNKINTTEAGRGIVGTNKNTSDDKSSTGVNKKIESVLKKEKEKSSEDKKLEKPSQKLTKTDEKLGVNQNYVTMGNSGSTASKAEKIGEKLETNSSDQENVIGMKMNQVQTNVSQAENSVESASEILDTRAQRRKERELKDAQRRAEKEKQTSGKHPENENASSQAPNSATRNEDSKSSSNKKESEKEISSRTQKHTEAKKPIENPPNDSKTEKQSNSTAEVLDTRAQRRNDRARRDGKQNEKTNQVTENETKSESAAKESSESNSLVDKKIGSTQAKSRENDSNDKKIETKKASANGLDPKAQRQNNRTQRDERGDKKREEKEKDASEDKTVDKSSSLNMRPEKAVKSETEPPTDDKNSASENQEKEESAPRKAARERFERNRTEKQKARDQKLATEPKSQNGDTDKDGKNVLNEKSDDPETVKKKEREKELRQKRLEEEEEHFLEELRKKKTAEEKRKKEEQQKKESQRMIIVGLFILLLLVTILIQTNKNH
ncbi:titin homolog [Symsagittifera roscoffensis]|uniref:titin homolog n=1 Tax=Symsagittifera roscoffensis TaxID=84072 RepID=UPI00307B9C9B